MQSQILNIQNNGCLTVAEISTDGTDKLIYISGDTAIKQRKLIIEEVSESGSVNDLLVKNLSDQYVFMMDGDILIGAKQNRVLNTSVYIAPETKSKINVSCVESGRWADRTKSFTSADFTMDFAMRCSKSRATTKSLREKRGHYADQNEVWDRISDSHSSRKIYSDTSDYSEIYETSKKDIKKFVNGFKPYNSANGMSVFINNKLICMDIFGRKDIYCEYFPKLLKGAAQDAIFIKKKKEFNEAEIKYKTVDFLDKFDDMKFTTHKGLCEGQERRFETKEVSGFELLFENNSIHLTGLNIQSEK